MRNLIAMVALILTAPFMILFLREMDRLERRCNNLLDDGSDEHNQAWLQQIQYLESCWAAKARARRDHD